MVQGFSKLSKEEKRNWLYQNYFKEEKGVLFENYDIKDEKLQNLHDEFIENTIANYVLPLGIAPNFLVNGKFYSIPMVIEESSVVAAVSKVAKFWAERGGFTSKVISTEKNGQVHFFFYGEKQKLFSFFEEVKSVLIEETAPITENMRKRHGGITKIELLDKTQKLENYFQINVCFETLDAMGANFINSCLEKIAKVFEFQAIKFGLDKDLEILMSILSNFVPNCLVRAEVSCPVKAMSYNDTSAEVFSKRFVQAISVANAEVHRAVTHNKGIMNGIDALALATGNDFRAIEAGLHAYASKDGNYKSLSSAEIKDDNFHFWTEIPLALGTVGGLTKLHPMVKNSLQILENPSAKTLMQLMAVVGLAQNFAAVSSLITSGIQKGHMKMHLMNILNQLGASGSQKEKAVLFFENKVISFSEVEKFLKEN